MKEKILGITDCRPPGRNLSNLEAKIFLKDFNISEDKVEFPYGDKSGYFFYKKHDKFFRYYSTRSYESLKLATDLQDRLSHYNLAPKVFDESCSENRYINISEFVPQINSKIDNVALDQNLTQLHEKLFHIMHKWRKGFSITTETTNLMHTMLLKYSTKMFKKYEVNPDFISNFYETLSWIKEQDNYGHGDMHPSNILQGNKDYIFIDFESVFQSKGGAYLDFNNLSRYNLNLVNNSKFFLQVNNYLYVKNAIVNYYLESMGKHVSLHEREKFLQKIR